MISKYTYVSQAEVIDIESKKLIRFTREGKEWRGVIMSADFNGYQVYVFMDEVDEDETR